MGFIDVASNNSLWRGIDYYNDKKVISWESTGENTYSGLVEGSGDNRYQVHIDTVHPRSSTCTCSFASGRKVVCKHMIALYFTANPSEYDSFMKQVEQWEEEEEQEYKEHIRDLEKYVKSLSKTQLQERLLDLLISMEEQDHYRW